MRQQPPGAGDGDGAASDEDVVSRDECALANAIGRVFATDGGDMAAVDGDGAADVPYNFITS